MAAGIEASELGPYLTADWSDWAPPEKLARLRAQVAEPSTAAARRPDPAAAAAIVERTLAAAAAGSPSLWSRFKEWVRSFLGEPRDEGQSGWLADWLSENLPIQKSITAILYLLVAALVAGIGWIVYSELRAAGWLRRRAPQRSVPVAGTAAVTGTAALAGATESEAPSILVALLVGELRRLGRVQDRLGMTHRELGRAVQFDAAADGAVFDGVLGAAEHVRYAATLPTPDVLRRVVDAGCGLLEQLMRQSRSAA